MRLDKKLNLVIPLEREGEKAYIHSMPISFDTFELFSVVLTKTFSRLMSEGLNFVGGPGVAAVILEETAERTYRRQNPETGDRETWLDGPDGVKNGLFGEMTRLSNYIFYENGSWNQIPFEAAINRNLLEREEIFEVKNQLTFFTVCSHAPPRGDRRGLIEGGASLFGSLTTLSSCTEYLASLSTSTEKEISAPRGIHVSTES